MARANCPSGKRRGEVCIYYKESLPIKMLNISYLQECICFDLKIGNKPCSIISLYKSPSQTTNEFDNFLNNLNIMLESVTQKNPFLTVVIGDFNARLSKWWSDDRTTQEGLRIEKLLSKSALSQVINKPTHISHSISSCIDLFFSIKENSVTDSRIHPLLHSNCHHQIIYEHANVDMSS